MRLALGQQGTPTMDTILKEIKKFHEEVGKTPCAAASFYQRKKDLSVAEKDVSNQARHLMTYAKTFFGGHRQLCEAADISVRSTKTSGGKKKAKPVKKSVQQLDLQKAPQHVR